MNVKHVLNECLLITIFLRGWRVPVFCIACSLYSMCTYTASETLKHKTNIAVEGTVQ